jgi:alkylhydroperoxidase family enzyme
MGAALVLVLHERLTLSDIELILFRDRPWTRVWLRGRLGLRWCVNYFMPYGERVTTRLTYEQVEI